MGLFMRDDFSLIPVRERAAEIMRCNDMVQRFGIKLSGNDALSLLAARDRALKTSGRIEFEKGAIELLLKTFCDSPYLNQDNFTETMEDIIDIFYGFKSDALDLIDDAEAVSFLKRLFDDECAGSADALRDEAGHAARAIRSGGATGLEDIYDE